MYRFLLLTPLLLVWKSLHHRLCNESTQFFYVAVERTKVPLIGFVLHQYANQIRLWLHELQWHENAFFHWWRFWFVENLFSLTSGNTHIVNMTFLSKRTCRSRIPFFTPENVQLVHNVCHAVKKSIAFHAMLPSNTLHAADFLCVHWLRLSTSETMSGMLSTNSDLCEGINVMVFFFVIFDGIKIEIRWQVMWLKARNQNSINCGISTRRDYEYQIFFQLFRLNSSSFV